MTSGFTLVEILIVMTILTILVAGIVGVLNVGDTIYSVDMGLLDLQQGARQAMSWMTREMREARGVTIAGGQLSFNTPNENNIKYYRDAGQNRIIREYPTGTTRILANHISSLSFCCLHGGTCDAVCSSPESVQIQITAFQTAKQKALSFSLKEKVRLRNE